MHVHLLFSRLSYLSLAFVSLHLDVIGVIAVLGFGDGATLR